MYLFVNYVKLWKMMVSRLRMAGETFCLNHILSSLVADKFIKPKCPKQTRYTSTVLPGKCFILVSLLRCLAPTSIFLVGLLQHWFW